MKIIGVISLGTGGVGKSTISLALATSLHPLDLTILLESTSYIYKTKIQENETLGSSFFDVENYSMIKLYNNNLGIIGIPDSEIYDAELTRRILYTTINAVKLSTNREPKFIIFDFPAIINADALEIADQIIIVTRPIEEILNILFTQYRTIAIGRLVKPVRFIINFFPPKLNPNKEKDLVKLGINPQKFREANPIIIPELNVPKTSAGTFEVAKYIVKKKLLEPIIREIVYEH